MKERRDSEPASAAGDTEIKYILAFQLTSSWDSGRLMFYSGRMPYPIADCSRFSSTKHSSNSHVVILRMCYYIQGSRLSVGEDGRKLQLSKLKQPSAVLEALKPILHQSRYLRARLPSTEPQAKHRTFQFRNNQKKHDKTINPLTWPPKHMVFCPASQTTKFIYSWVSLLLHK